MDLMIHIIIFINILYLKSLLMKLNDIFRNMKMEKYKN